MVKKSIEEIKESNNDLSRYAYFMTATFNDESVFIYGNCHPAINYVSFVVNCHGDTLGYTNELYDQLKQVTVFWKPDDSLCNFND
ncbi:MAG: hypothetical protein HC906_00910 [Bacteroidales bacterium]|nr:hypothetical protein [Bacteroidales bacterium]